MQLLVQPSAGKVFGWDDASTLTNKTLASSAVALPGSGRTVSTLSAYLANHTVFNALDFGDNLKKAAYPAILAETSLNDSQVGYWEAAKYVAKLRTLKTDRNPVLLKTIMEAGHGGASGRYDALKELAFTYAFILDQMGLAGR